MWVRSICDSPRTTRFVTDSSEATAEGGGESLEDIVGGPVTAKEEEGSPWERWRRRWACWSSPTPTSVCCLRSIETDGGVRVTDLDSELSLSGRGPLLARMHRRNMKGGDGVRIPYLCAKPIRSRRHFTRPPRTRTGTDLARPECFHPSTAGSHPASSNYHFGGTTRRMKR